MDVYEIRTNTKELLYKGDDYNLAVESYYDFQEESENDINSPIFGLEIIGYINGKKDNYSYSKGGALKGKPLYSKGEAVSTKDGKNYRVISVLRDTNNDFHYRLSSDLTDNLLIKEEDIITSRDSHSTKLSEASNNLIKLTVVNEFALVESGAMREDEIYEDDKKAKIYLREIKEYLERNNYRKPMSMSTYKWIEEGGFHTLNNALAILGYYGPEMRETYSRGYVDSSNMYINPNLIKLDYHHKTYTQKIAALEMIRREMEKDEDVSPKDLFRVEMKIEMLKEQSDNKYEKGGTLEYELNINKIKLNDVNRAIEIEQDSLLRGVDVRRSGKTVIIRDFDRIDDVLGLLTLNLSYKYPQTKLNLAKGGEVEKYIIVRGTKESEKYYYQKGTNEHYKWLRTKKGATIFTDIKEAEKYADESDGDIVSLTTYAKGGKVKITSYDIDEDGTLHTYIGERKHVTFSDVKSDKEAERLIKEENEYLAEEYAKGGALEKEFKFDKNFVVYVPSTSDVSDKISPKELEARVKEVKKYVATEFGGYTETETEGGYRTSKGDIVEEEVVKVSVFSETKDWREKEYEVVKKAKQWAKEWGQEAVGFEYEGDLYYIEQNGKLDKQEKMSWGGTLSMPRGSGWGDYKKGKRVLKIKDLKPRTKYLSYSKQFDAKNVVYILPPKPGSEMFTDTVNFMYMNPYKKREKRGENDIAMKIREGDLQDNVQNYDFYEIKEEKDTSRPIKIKRGRDHRGGLRKMYGFKKGGNIPKGHTKELETEDFIWYVDENGEYIIMIRKSDGSVASDNYFAENDLYERMVEIANGREKYIYLRPESKQHLKEFKEDYENGGTPTSASSVISKKGHPLPYLRGRPNLAKKYAPGLTGAAADIVGTRIGMDVRGKGLDSDTLSKGGAVYKHAADIGVQYANEKSKDGEVETPGMGGYDEAIMDSQTDKVANTVVDAIPVAVPFKALGEAGSKVIVGKSEGEDRKKKQVIAAGIFAPHKLFAMRKARDKARAEARAQEDGYAKGGLTPSKAKQILEDGEANGKALTEKQKRYFGWIAGGGRGKYADGGRVYAIDPRDERVKDISYINELTDDEFRFEAEEQGYVWSSMDNFIDSNEFNDSELEENLIHREIKTKQSKT